MCESKVCSKSNNYQNQIKVQNDIYYRFFCFVYLYSLAIYYYFHELTIKLKRLTGNNLFELDQNKDALRSNTSDLTVLITGGERGIGWETSKMFLARNCKVIIGGLVPKGQTEADILTSLQNQIDDPKQKDLIQFWQLDLSSMASVCQFVRRVNQHNVNVNILINNAGVMNIGFKVTQDGFERVLAINYLGHCLLTLLLKSNLQSAASKSGVRSRLVFVSSSTHYVLPINLDELQLAKDIPNYKYSDYSAYSQSKSFIILFAHHLSRINPDLDVVTLHPGVASSNLYTHENLFNFFPVLFYGMRTPAEAAVILVYSALCTKLEKQTGLYIEDKQIIKPGKHTQVAELQQSIYDRTVQLLDSWL